MRNFFEDELGAVTVDWTVITAGIVGLGLAVTAVVTVGMRDLSTDVRDAITDVNIVDRFDAVLSNWGFDGGDRGAWTAGTVENIPGFGELLVIPRGGDEATLPIEVGDEYSYAVVEFDMVFGDSWDNETGTISIAGQEVVVGTHSWREGEPDIRIIEGANDTEVTLTRSSVGTGGFRPGGGSTDYTYGVRVVAANDGTDLTLGASTTLNSRTGDEFFGIDNVQVTGSDNP